MNNDSTEFYALANGMSISGTMGGNINIFLELTRRWARRLRVNIITHEEGFKTCQDHGLKHVKFHVLRFGSRYLKVQRVRNFRALVFDIVKTIEALSLLLSLGGKGFSNKAPIIYSATDFWPDAIPAAVLKLRFKNKIEWVAGFWLFAPNPFSKESPYKGKSFIRGLLFYLYQFPIYCLVNKYADMVFVTSEPDVHRFITKNRGKSRILIVRGGVDTKLPEQVPEPESKEFDAVFIGRFHLQKGVLELIDIWKLVMEKKRNARLAMIGNGPLEEEVKAKLEKYGLERNIKLFGFKDGIEKIKIFKSSRIVVHPAIFDSGGMAACEAMSAGLPGVSFDLEALKTYYPKGMIKTPCFDLKAFAKNILLLLSDEELYQKTRHDALEWSKEWDWDKRADKVLEDIWENI